MPELMESPKAKLSQDSVNIDCANGSDFVGTVAAFLSISGDSSIETRPSLKAKRE